jgi:hypothetical protein
MFAYVNVPSVGQPQERVTQEQNQQIYTLNLRPIRARYVANDYREADELELTMSYDDAGIDPRFLRSAEVAFYLGNADDDGTFTPSLANNVRFIGIVTTVERETGPTGRYVKLRALDYTTLFIGAKSFPQAGIPDFSQTIRAAWERICDNTGPLDFSTGEGKIISTVQNFKKKLELIGVPESTTLGKAVPARLAKLGKLQVHHEADAWAVWQTAVGSLGLISFIRGDRCIVTTATDFYTRDDPPVFVNGKNVVELVETRDQGALSHKGLCLQSFDPLAGRTLEAFWPPKSSFSKKKKVGASLNLNGQPIVSQDYERMACPLPCADQGVLLEITKQAYEERSRYELQGRMKIVDMFVETESGETFDVLKLQAGDAIRVEINRESLGLVQKKATVGERMSDLRDLGYSQQMAQYIVNNLDAIVRMPPQFLIRSVSTTYELATGGSERITYETEIEFCNRIHVDGSAVVPKDGGTKQPPFADQTFDTADVNDGQG